IGQLALQLVQDRELDADARDRDRDDLLALERAVRTLDDLRVAVETQVGAGAEVDELVLLLVLDLVVAFDFDADSEDVVLVRFLPTLVAVGDRRGVVAEAMN